MINTVLRGLTSHSIDRVTFDLLVSFYGCHSCSHYSVIDLHYQRAYTCFKCLDAGPPSPAAHLRAVFYRMGLDDKVCITG